MKPDPNVSGVPFNFDAIPMWLCPSLWDETKHVNLRGLWFVLLYTLSFMIFGALFIFPLAMLFHKPMNIMVWVWLCLSIPFGVAIGFAAWWDFSRHRKQLLLEEARKKSEVQLQESPPK